MNAYAQAVLGQHTYLEMAGTTASARREQLILEHLPQVRLIARRIHERLPESVCLEDLISSGTLGLITAIDHFDPAQNVKLKTYAEYRIRGAILDSLRGLDWAPRQSRRMSREIENAIQVLEQRNGRTPTEEEITEHLGLSTEQYQQRLMEIEGLKIGELSSPGGDDSAPQLQYAADDSENSPSQILERAELERLIATGIERLPKIERTVVSLYYKEELSLREIAEILELHLSRISQLKTQAILRLRTLMEKRWPLTGGMQSAKQK